MPTLKRVLDVHLLVEVDHVVDSSYNQALLEVEVAAKFLSFDRELLDAWCASSFDNFSQVSAVHLLAKLDLRFRSRCVVNIDERVELLGL